MSGQLCLWGQSSWKVFSLVISCLFSIGCGNPFALNINQLNLIAKQKRGIIQFSDPKLFPREHLINERREDLAFLATALDACNQADIQPEVIRELEIVRLLAAGFGLKIDPASTRNFESSKEIANLKNEIAKIRLEMQLAQLRRDAELLKDQLDVQKSLSNQPKIENDENALSPTTVSEGATAPTTDEINKLLEKVDKIVNDLQGDAQSNISALTKKGGTAGQIDIFNNRKACRDTIKSVINQTRLDDLHDMDGNTLVRIQVRATVLPGEKKYNDTLGILRMEVEPPPFNDNNSSLTTQVYRNWLDYVNRNINRLQNGRIITTPRFLVLQQYFKLLYFEVPKSKNALCSGLSSTERKPEECWYLRVALPFTLANFADVLIQAPNILVDQLKGAAKAIRDETDVQKIANPEFKKTCDVEFLNNEIELKRLKNPERPGKTAREAMRLATNIKLSRPILAVLASLRDSFEYKQLGSEILLRMHFALKDGVFPLINAANELQDAIASKFPNCKQKNKFKDLSVPDKFKRVLRFAAQRVAAYDVAPAEKVQPVSTAARATEALTLAASMVDSLPESGLGARGNLAFSRSAVGKADAIELAPIVVGFAEPVHTVSGKKTKSSFGWLLGPKAVVKPKEQELAFVHPIKPYELYADLSLPGWWPWFKLKTYTAWAPNWRRTDSTTTMDISGNNLVRTIKVPMRPKAGDMDGLTTMLLKEADVPVLEAPQIVSVEPKVISPCDGRVDFQIWGDNVWRTSMVHFGGRAIDREQIADDGSVATAIKVLPDMRGIVASVDISQAPIRRGTTGLLTIWTPDGRDTMKIKFHNILNKDNSCGKRSGPPRKSEAPTIGELRPARVSSCAGMVKFQLMGSNLTSNAKVNIGGVEGTNVATLPSKKGLAFDLDISQIKAIEKRKALVSVSTEGGDASTVLAFSDHRKSNNECGSTQEMKKPTISKIVPSQISICTSEVSFTAEGTNIYAPVEARLGGVTASVFEELPPKNGTLVRFKVDLSKFRKTFVGLETTTADIRTTVGLASIDITLKGKHDDCS